MSTKKTRRPPATESSLRTGSLDPDFGINGAVVLKGPSGAEDSFITGMASNLTSDTDQRIYVGTSDPEPYITRLLPNGEIDESFGSAGYLTLPQGNPATFDTLRGIHTFIPMTSGKIIGWGQLTTTRAQAFNVPAAVCFTADGVLDTTFGTNGLATYKQLIPKTALANDLNSPSKTESRGAPSLNIETHGEAGRLTAFRPIKQAGDKLLLCDSVSYPVSPYHIASYLIRINADGSLDTDFGQGGFILIKDPDYSTLSECGHFDTDRGGGIVVTGTHYRTENPLFIARYDSEGHVDRSFGENGVVHINNPNGYAVQDRGVIAMDDGKIILTAAFFVAETISQHAVLIKLLPTGDRDPGFNNGEPTLVDLTPEGYFVAHTATLDDGQRIVIGGRRYGEGLRACISRVQPNGALDTGFGSNGTAVLGRFQEVWLMTVQNRVNILASGVDLETEPPLTSIYRVLG